MERRVKDIELEILITLFSSWLVYGACQQDVILPGICGMLLLIAFIRNRKTINNPAPVQRPARIPSFHLIGTAFLFGWLWRGFLPDSALLVVNAPKALKVTQSALVIFSLLMWFQQSYLPRFYSLRLLAWMITALSINVPFDAPATAAFRIFCGINVWFILIKPHLRVDRPGKTLKRLKAITASATYLTAFMVTSGVLFSGLIYTVKWGDQTFTQFIHDYLQPYQHPFFSLQPTLDLRGPGYSGRDIRPILEIEDHENHALYLSTQVFEHYHDGTWREPDNISRQPVSNAIDPSSIETRLIMFDHLQGVIPSPEQVSAVKSRHHIFQQDENQIIHAPAPAVLKVFFRMGRDHSPVFLLSETRKRALTDLSPSLKQHLKPYVEEIIGTETNPAQIAKTIEAYFRQNFQYSLDVMFAANERGLLAMLHERKPAYCSYFATAMILLLRERGIPARLRVGFLVTEGINDGQLLLARVRDAHAWVEVLLPMDGSQYHWVRFAPTPSASRCAPESAP
jgi:hypothetical protein